MKNNILLTFILIFVSLVANSQTELSKNEALTIRNKIVKASKSTETITNNFKQSKHLSFLSKDIISYGKLVFKAPNLIKWEYNKPFKYQNAGKLILGDFEIRGQGLVRISQDKNRNLIYHWFESEILPNSNNPYMQHSKLSIGKCKYYYVVDPKTKVIKNWGFDKGGNPLSCSINP